MSKKKVNIKAKMSPMRRHVRFLKLMEKQGDIAYRYVMAKMLLEVKEVLRQEKLMKSDKFDSGWTGSVPTIKLDISKSANKVINKYMKALAWVMVGDYAGTEARSIAKNIGLTEKVTPGITQASYLNSLDMNRDYYEILTKKNAPDIPKMLMQGSLENIANRTLRQINQITGQLENALMMSLESIFEDFNNKNYSRVIKEAHKLEGDSEEILQQASEKAKTTIAKSAFEKEFRRNTKKFQSTWSRNVVGETGIASGVGTHQAINEIYGATDGRIKVVVLTSRDDRVCDFCNKISMNPDGSFKYYDLSEIKPAGYNFGRKRADWGVSVPTHINCRCVLVYVPRGFKALETGELVPDNS